MNGWCLRDECVSAACLPASIKLNQIASTGPMKWERKPRIWAGVAGGQRSQDGSEGV